MEVILKILQEGDEVLNIWPDGSGYGIAVRQKNSEVYVCSLTLDEEKVPRLNKRHPLTITFGCGEVEVNIPTVAKTFDNESQEEQGIITKNQSIKVRTF